MNAGGTNSAPYTVEEILAENRRRLGSINAPYDPVAGDHGDPERMELDIPGLSDSKLFIPRTMAQSAMVAALMRAGSLDRYILAEKHVAATDSMRETVRKEFTRLRILHDFPFWAASFVFIKTKGGGEDMLFTLNRPQRKLVAALEDMRRAGKPIRLILLKARQWGGSALCYLLIYLDNTEYQNVMRLLKNHNK